MRIVRILSVVGLAGYLVLSGLYYLAELHSPALHSIIGIIGLAAGALMFISIGHWFDFHKENK